MVQMRTLDNVLAFKIKKRRSKPRAREKIPPDKKFLQNIRYIQRVIKRGDYNPNYAQHAMKANSAIKHGYLDKELNILKEA
jgi:hypothetical protein